MPICAIAPNWFRFEPLPTRSAAKSLDVKGAMSCDATYLRLTNTLRSGPRSIGVPPLLKRRGRRAIPPTAIATSPRVDSVGVVPTVSSSTVSVPVRSGPSSMPKEISGGSTSEGTSMRKLFEASPTVARPESEGTATVWSAVTLTTTSDPAR